MWYLNHWRLALAEVQVLMIEQHVKRFLFSVTWDAQWIVDRSKTRSLQCWIVVGCEESILACPCIFDCCIVGADLLHLILMSGLM